MKFLSYYLLFFILSTSCVFAEEHRAVVNLIVSGRDSAHVEQVIDAARRLSKRVAVRNILIVLKDVSDAENLLYTTKSSSGSQGDLELKNSIKVIRTFGLSSSEIAFDVGPVRRLRLSYSPTWMVRYKGNDYVYEGYPTIEQYFTRTGKFTRGLE